MTNVEESLRTAHVQLKDNRVRYLLKVLVPEVKYKYAPVN
jgi:hypothetical protein